MNNNIPQTDYDIEEVIQKIKDIAEFHGVVLSGNVAFYKEIVEAHYILDIKNKIFYPEFIATTDIPQQVKNEDCN